MKLKRILCTFLSLLMVIGCFGAVTVSAVTDSAPEIADGIVTVYVGGENAASDNAGTLSAPVDTINGAIAVVNNAAATAENNITSAKVVLLGDVKIAMSAYEIEETAHDVPITYVSNPNADKNYTITFEGTRANLARYHIGGDVVFDNVVLKATGYTLMLSANGYSLTTTKNADVLASDDTNKAISVCGGYKAKLYGSSSYTTTWNSTDISLNAGTFGSVYPATGTNGGTISKDVNLFLGNAATVNYLDIASGTSGWMDVKGSTNIVMDGATVNNFRLACASVATSLKSNRFFKTVKITIKNDTIFKTTIFPTSGTNYSDFYAGESTIADDIEFQGGLIFDICDFDVSADMAYDTLKTRLDGIVDKVPGASYYDINFTATQTNFEAGKDMEKYNVRFLAAVRDFSEFEAIKTAEVGFEIIATYTENGVVYKKDLSKCGTNVYEEIQATEEGVNKKVSAGDIGGNYIIALTVQNIPVSVGEVTFTVTPYITDGAAENPTVNRGVTRTTTYNAGVWVQS